jgi:hypothetical protein
MKALVTVALAGCITGAGFVRPDRVTIPILIGAAAADFIVTSVAASQLDSLSLGGSLATGAALTGVDLAVGCILGSCSALRL